MQKATLPLVLLLLAAACGGDRVVATANGAEISLVQVEALRTGGTVSTTDFANDLRDSIFEALLTAAASEEFGITVNAEQAEARYQELIAQVESDGTVYETFLEQQQISDERVRRAAVQQLLREAVEAELLPEVTDDEVKQRYDDTPAEQYTVCVKHILMPSEDEIAAVQAKLDGGADFGTIASEFSTDPSAAQNQGDLGCNRASLFVEPFASATVDAEVGEVAGPVQTEFGWHLVLVLDRVPRSFETAAAEIRAILDQTRAREQAVKFGEWFDQVVKAATVEVNADYGTWVTEPVAQVLPAE